MSKTHLIFRLGVIAVLAMAFGQDCTVDFSVDGDVDLDGTIDVDVNDGDPNSGDDAEMLTFTTAPADLVLDCTTEDNDETLAAWLESARAATTKECKPVAITHDYTGLSDSCDVNGWVTTVTWSAEDDCGEVVQTLATLTILNPDPPVITLIGEAEIVLPTGSPAHVEEGATVAMGCGLGEATAEVGGDLVDTNTPGTYVVTYDATDACGLAATQMTRTVHVVDPPEFTVLPGDLELDCETVDAATALSDWLGSAEAEADAVCGEVTVSSEIVGLAESCMVGAWSLAVEWVAVDECGLSTTIASTLTLLNAPEPTIALVGDEAVTHECGEAYAELGATVHFGCANVTLPATMGGDIVLPNTLGTYNVTYQLADACGHATEELIRTVEVVDTLGPDVVLADAELELWPPNHMYETLTLADCVESVYDLCEGELDLELSARILSIASDEPENSNGDGNTVDDIVIVDATTFMLRSERRGGGNGRVYTIHFVVMDSSGNETDATCTASVPHDQSGEAAIDDGPAYTVTLE